MRKPAVAGMFYPKNRDELIKQIEECFLSKLGVGKLPERTFSEERSIVGAVVPHAGYIYSGYEASYVYYELSRQKKPDTVILLGPNHHGLGSLIAVSSQDWETPLGVAKIDKELAERFYRNCSIIDLNEDSHAYEHSIEVQLPFLQYIYGDFKFVPISMTLQDLDVAREVAECIVKNSEDRDVVVLASSDFTHYEDAEVAKRKDMLAIEKILNMDEKGFLKVVYENDISICGYGAIAVAIMASKMLGAKKARLLKYGNSGDVVGDYSSVVAYAAIVFEK